MRLELSSEGRYAIRALVYLAGQSGRVSAETIAAEAGIPRRLLARILAELSRAGLVASKTGREGGSQLARDPRLITMRDVVEAVEGPFQVNQCILESRACDGSRPCAMHAAWLVAQQALLDQLARTTLADLAASVAPTPLAAITEG